MVPRDTDLAFYQWGSTGLGLEFDELPTAFKLLVKIVSMAGAPESQLQLTRIMPSLRYV